MSIVNIIKSIKYLQNIMNVYLYISKHIFKHFNFKYSLKNNKLTIQ